MRLGDEMSDEVPSPDRGDAVLGCIACGARMSGAMSAQDLAEVSPRQRHDGGFATPLVTGW